MKTIHVLPCREREDQFLYDVNEGCMGPVIVPPLDYQIQWRQHSSLDDLGSACLLLVAVCSCHVYLCLLSGTDVDDKSIQQPTANMLSMQAA